MRSPLTEVINRVQGMITCVRENLSDDEYNLFLDLLVPEQEPAPNNTPKKRRPTVKCAHEGCGRALTNDIHDPDAGHSDWHNFIAPPPGQKKASKSRRASSIQSAIQGTPKPATCAFMIDDATGEKCSAAEGDPIHDRTYISSHEFQPKGAAKAAGGE